MRSRPSDISNDAQIEAIREQLGLSRSEFSLAIGELRAITLDSVSYMLLPKEPS